MASAREARLAFIAAFVLYVLTARGLTLGDEAVPLDLALAFLHGHRTLSIDPGDHWIATRPIAGGLFYQDDDGLHSASSPGMALLAVVPVAIASFGRAPISFDAFFAREPRSPRAIVRPLARDPRVIVFACIAPIAGAFAVALVVLAGAELGLSRAARIASAAALGVGSPLFAYAGTCWTQLPATAALALSIYGLAARQARSSARVWPIALGSSIAVLVRPELLVMVVIAIGALYFIERSWRRSPSRALARVLVPVAIGSIVAFWDVGSSEGASLRELPIGIAGLLASPRTGLLVYAPFVILAPWGMPRLARPIACVLIGWPIAALVAYGGWFDWPASLAYGPRFLVPILPVLALAFGAAFDSFRRMRVLAVLAIVLGALIELPGALLAHLRIEEPDRFFHPTFVSAWLQLLSGRDAIGELGVDCASTYVLAYPIVAVLVAAIGVHAAAQIALRSAR